MQPLARQSNTTVMFQGGSRGNS